MRIRGSRRWRQEAELLTAIMEISIRPLTAENAPDMTALSEQLGYRTTAVPELLNTHSFSSRLSRQTLRRLPVDTGSKAGVPNGTGRSPSGRALDGRLGPIRHPMQCSAAQSHICHYGSLRSHCARS